MVGGAIRRLGRGARRAPWIPATAALVVITVVAVVTTNRPTRGDPTVATWVRVGVDHGSPIGPYLERARADLGASAADAGPIYALAGFNRYVDPYELAAVLDGAAVEMVLTRVPINGEQPELVRLLATRLPGDVVAGMAETARRKEAEAVRYADLAAAATEPRPRSVYSAAQRLAAAEAAAYRRHCACVYAAVLRAASGVLTTVGSHSEVRFVDPAPEVRRLDRAVFLPPLPEQAGLAGPP